MSWINTNKKLAKLKAELKKNEFDETTIYMISQLNPSWVKKLMLSMRLVTGFDEGLHDMLDEIIIEEIKEGHEYTVELSSDGFGEPQIYTRLIWL